MAQPQWVKDYMAGKVGSHPQAGQNKVREQFTVVRRYPAGGERQNTSLPPSPMQSPIQPLQGSAPVFNNNRIPAPMSAPSRMTGNGVDGIPQPSKMAGQVHESEGVLSANAMQNLAPDEFTAFSSALESGSLDKNAFRQAIGMPPVRGYQSGGIVEEERANSTPIGNQTAAPSMAPLTTAPTAQSTPKSVITPLSSLNVHASKPVTSTSTPVNNTQTQNQTATTIPVQPKIPSIEPLKVSIPKQQTQPQQVITPMSALNAQTAYENKLLTGQGAAQAAADAATQQTLAQQNASQARSTNVMAELNRTQENANDELRSNLTQQNVNNLVTFQNLDLNTNQRNEQVLKNVQNRLSTLFIGGSSLEKAKTDQTLRDAVKSYLGQNASEIDIDNEIALQYNGQAEANKSTFATNSETLIGDAIDTNKTIDQIVNDPSIRRNIGGFLGPNATEDQITTEIKARYDQIKKPDVDRIFDNMVNNGWVDSDVMNVKGWEDDLKQTIRDLRMKGILDKDGNIKDGASVEWPWDAPDTYFKYNDWNGNAAAGGKYDQTAVIALTGNGTDYKTADGKAVTMADANKVWDSLSPLEQEEFFKDGKPDIESFLKKYFKTSKNKNGDSSFITDKESFDQDVIDDPDYLSGITALADEWVSAASYPDDPDAFGESAGKPLSTAQFLYYDDNGEAQVTGKSDPKLAYIWQQLSDKYNNGDLLTADQFAAKWQEGKPWRIGSDGTIKNIDTPNKEVDSGEREYIQALSNWDKTSTKQIDTNIVSALKNISEEDMLKNTDIFANGTISADSPYETYNKKKYTGSYLLEETDNYAGNSISNQLRTWVTDNKGKFYRTKGGVTYQILGYEVDGGDNVVLRDVNTNKIIEWGSNGKPTVVGDATDTKFTKYFTGLK
jgi:hypothetical protein